MGAPNLHGRTVSGGAEGSGFWTPVRTISRRLGDGLDVHDEVFANHLKHRCDWYDDFLGDTLLDEVRVYEMSPSGTPTAAIQADGRNGILELTLASTNEYELALYDWGTIQNIPMTKRPYWQGRINVKVLPTTNEELVFGLASQLTISANNSLDADVVTNCWFKLAASGALLAETDDGTTDDDDNDCAFTLDADTYYWFTIDATNPGRVSFQLAAADGSRNREVCNLAASAWAVTDLVSPFVALKKASGTGVPSVYVDMLRCSWDR